MTTARRLKVFKNDDGDWWWHVLGANSSDKVSGSLQGYSRLKDALHMAAELHPELPVDIEGDGDSEADNRP